MNNVAFPKWPSFTKQEAHIVKDIILSNKVNYWTGQEGRQFEKEFADYIGTKFSIALNNGTLALELSLIALGIGNGDEVIVTSRSFMASVSCIVNVGAIPIFADIDLNSQNITTETVEPLISKKTKAIICVHLAGYPCEMDKFRDLANNYKLFIVEDCAQAHGAKFKDKMVGSLSDVAAWSFCQDKIMTTAGEGGMVTTDNEEIWNKIWSLKDHGKSWDAIYKKKHPPGFRWVHYSFGTNARMMEVQSGIGRYQLKKINDWHLKRLDNLNKIWESTKDIDGLITPIVPDFIEHAAYKCYLRIDMNSIKSSWSRDRILVEINNLGVPCFSGSCSEIYNEKAFENSTFRPKKFLKNARLLGEESLMFVVHPTLKKEHIDKTIDSIQKVYLKAKK